MYKLRLFISRGLVDSDSLDHVVLSLSWSRLVMNNRLDMLSDLVMGAR